MFSEQKNFEYVQQFSHLHWWITTGCSPLNWMISHRFFKIASVISIIPLESSLKTKDLSTDKKTDNGWILKIFSLFSTLSPKICLSNFLSNIKKICWRVEVLGDLDGLRHKLKTDLKLIKLILWHGTWCRQASHNSSEPLFFRNECILHFRNQY